MKHLMILVLLLGLIAASCSPPIQKAIPAGRQIHLVQGMEDQVQVPVISAMDETMLPAPDTPAPIKWVDENFWSTVSGILLLIYEFLALKMPTSRSISILGNLYKLLTWVVPDKSNKGGQFSIRDKL